MSIYYTEERFIPVPQKVRHGFFGTQGGVSTGLYASLNCGLSTEDNPLNVKENKKIALSALGLEGTRLHSLYQIHSNTCFSIDAPTPFNEPLKGDALVTDIPGITLGILTADCAPILFYGEKEDGSPVIGTAHAGWKGAIGGIIHNTVKTMLKKGTKKESLKAVIGPAIGPQSYEVDAEFFHTFREASSENERFFMPVGGSYYFDLPSFCEHQLHKSGISHVYQKNLDTLFHEDDFFSFRRATHRKDRDYGRQISLISIWSG